jgi:amino acid adenylation domain-containing protein
VRVNELLERRAALTPRKLALVCGTERYSYAQVDHLATRFADALVEHGLVTGDRVAICLENSVDAVAAIFGVLKAGGVFFVVNPQARVEYRDMLLDDSGAAAVIGRGPDGITRITWRWRPQGGALSSENDLRPHFDPDLAALVYTSGSTGTPKGVMLTHRNLTFAAESICTYLENSSSDVILSVLPLSFTYGLGQVTTAFRSGATLVLERSFTYPRAVLDTMRRERVTGIPIVPTIATLLLQQDLRMHRLPHLRYITNAAAALPGPKLQRLQAAFPHARIYLMYGQTECQRVSYLPPDLLDDCPASVGVPIPGTEAFILNERGERAATGEAGELVVRGPHVMKGYWNKPDATAAALDRDPATGETVLHTGDLFKTDERQLLYFVERKDDMIKVRGEKVAPRQVEEVIATLPGVAEVAVYGVADEVAGETIAACVTPSEGAHLTTDAIRRHCLERLEAYMVPKVVDIRTTMPTTASGKVSRRALRLLRMPRGASAA